MKHLVTRRGFLGAASASGALLTPVTVRGASNGKLAVNGGTPVRSKAFPSWPKIGSIDEQNMMQVLRSGEWFRGTSGRWTKEFEQKYAALLGTKHCLATANGTSALLTSLNALGVGPGDEVILPPYTFVATVNVILVQHAIPVFVDSDVETLQIDTKKIEAAITERTRVIMPVHLGGSVSNMDEVLAVAKKHNVPVIEDACQAHLAEWRKNKAGSLGATGCFSFQVSKNLSSGEGGAIITNDDELIERCYAFHNNGRGRRTSSYNFSYGANGANLRMTEFQGALLCAQMTRLEDQVKLREQNASYLTSLLREIPGISPARMYDGCTRNAYHLYMLRYRPEEFAGAPRNAFLKALNAEGIPCSGGYAPLNKEPFLKNMMASRGYKAIYPKEFLAKWEERNQCPANDRLCEEAVWFTQNMLLASRSDMDQIAEAVRKVRANAGDLKSA
ncbi:MAG: DegT/DnrJ/EryC1/StrS family aminotransferase [Bryobacteraceae bacterium]